MTIKNGIRTITYLKILGKDYEVRWYTPDPLLTQEINGRLDWNTGIILINSALDDDRSLDTLIHEIIHGICEDGAMPSITEEDVTRLASGLQQVIRDNMETILGAFSCGDCEYLQYEKSKLKRGKDE